MYSGSTLKQLHTLDTWFGAHQKIDRLARKRLAELTSETVAAMFPETKQIVHFEGVNGPDAIKRKTPAQDEPWHYYDPYDDKDHKLLDIIAAHHTNLVKALKAQKITRASFEAAWLAHAIVDGLTPAHHYPYESELIRLRGGAAIETRRSPKEKLLMPGDTITEKVRNNWQMWGDKGLLATHIAFEAGVALVILPLRYQSLHLAEQPPAKTIKNDYLLYFQSQAKKVAEARLYEQFYKTGWTPKLARQVRRDLIPILVDVVATVWCSALQEAQRKEKN